MSKIKVISNVQGGLGFYLNPAPDSFRILPKHETFLEITKEEIQYIYINQEIIQKGMLWIDDVDLRIEYGIEKEDGTKENMNALRIEEITALVSGNYKKLEKALEEVTEPIIISQFVDVARTLKIDSKAKIDVIEKASNMKIYDDVE